MRQLEPQLYERKVITDEEFPVQVFENRITKQGQYTAAHWHEHIEIHYIFQGHGTFLCNHIQYSAKEQDLIIMNSNELHELYNESAHLHAIVLIFEMHKFSRELADARMIFQNHIREDAVIRGIMTAILNEKVQEGIGYKIAMRGKIYELLTHLMRSYVAENISVQESLKRTQNLDRLNTVIQHIQNHYHEELTNRVLADLIHLSEYRFCHLFKESIGQSPLQFMNTVRLKAAMQMLQNTHMTITQISSEVGFRDYNHFGRLFRRRYGYPPSKVWEERKAGS